MTRTPRPPAAHPQPDALRSDHYDILFAPNDASVTDYLQSALFDLTTFEGGTDRAIDKVSRALGLLDAVKATWQPKEADNGLTTNVGRFIEA